MTNGQDIQKKKKDLKIEFDIHTNFTPFEYKKNWGKHRIDGPFEVQDLGHGRTRYVYNHSNKTSTTYFRSKWEDQAIAWEKLENMVQDIEVSSKFSLLF